MSVFVVVAGIDYESNWVVGLRSSMESAKRLAQEEYEVQAWRIGNVPARTVDGSVTGLISEGAVSCADFVTIAEWKVEP